MEAFMKRIFLTLLAASVMMLTASVSFGAPATCSDMAIVGTGTTPYTDSGLFVKVKPTKTNACGTAGTAIQYFLDVTNTDATYATILTALSLNKTLFIQVADPAKNSLLLLVSISN